MRMSPNDTPRLNASESERRCILSGDRAEKTSLTRLALGPDGQVAPDIRACAPGRGAWVGVDRAAFELALTKGKLKGALIRAFKTPLVIVPDDLSERLEMGLQRAALDRLGLESRAGHLLIGAEKIEQAARNGHLKLLLHAADAASDGCRKLAQAWRVGSETEGSGATGMTLVATRDQLAAALGRDNVVHIGIIDHAAAVRVQALLLRWHSFIGQNIQVEPSNGAQSEKNYEMKGCKADL